ncbi:hypothetical protein Tsubulata_016804 [Turnera subulata]|uniref:Uncharacterized protein n=1 Tax=Turnera subulata TaxID=218843 RepID=A0A9Q0F515_9ROSI|nr:hypothetical protein Tsubulata_016804 [Turnera subulata]
MELFGRLQTGGCFASAMSGDMEPNFSDPCRQAQVQSSHEALDAAKAEFRSAEEGLAAGGASAVAGQSRCSSIALFRLIDP